MEKQKVIKEGLKGRGWPGRGGGALLKKIEGPDFNLLVFKMRPYGSMSLSQAPIQSRNE